jgi:hypothetical protein
VAAKAGKLRGIARIHAWPHASQPYDRPRAARTSPFDAPAGRDRDGVLEVVDVRGAHHRAADRGGCLRYHPVQRLHFSGARVSDKGRGREN